jgi:hypothetical protein
VKKTLLPCSFLVDSALICVVCEFKPRFRVLRRNTCQVYALLIPPVFDKLSQDFFPVNTFLSVNLCTARGKPENLGGFFIAEDANFLVFVFFKTVKRCLQKI